MDVLRHVQSRAGMPAGAVQDEHDLLLGSGADGRSKGCEFCLEEGDGDAGGEVEDGPARTDRGGMDEADEVAPLIAMLDRRVLRALAGKGPDLLEDGLQADAVLVQRPRRDHRLRMGSGHITAQLADPL